MSGVRYCTPEWLEASVEAYRASPTFKQTLTKLSVKICFKIMAEPAWGIERDVIFGAFITQGHLERLSFFSEEDARKEAEFILAATPQEWKKLLRKESKFITDFLLGRVTQEQGSKVGILGIAHHADTLIDALTPVPLQFPDEMSPDELDQYRSYVEAFRSELGV